MVKDVVYSGAKITYSCSPDLTNGVNGNLTGNPDFIARSAGDYRLSPGSICIDAGTNLLGIGVDLEGSIRPKDGNGDGTATADMGCYEAPDATGGVFRCNFTAPVTAANGSLNVQFTAIVAGPKTNGLVYRWDYDNNGSVDEQGTDKQVVTHTYTTGVFSVSLTVSNDNSDVANRIKQSYITVYTANTYVATNGAHVVPFATWSTAATNIQAAVDSVMEGGSVTVSNGTYVVNEHVVLTKAVSVRSVNGAGVTMVKRGSAVTRLFSLSHSNAVIDGFTLLNGIAPSSLDMGGGVYMAAGTVMNCIITNGVAQCGGGVYMLSGMVTNSTVINCAVNTVNPQRGAGICMENGLAVACDVLNNVGTRSASGVYMSAGELRGCRVRGNSGGWGAAIFMAGPSLARNCLITGNKGGGYGTTYGDGGGVWMNHAGARIENCTVVGNSTTNTYAGGYGGGICLRAGAVTNCIVYYNKAYSASNDIAISGATNVGYTCSPDLTAVVNGNITAPPLFVNAGGGYGLTHTNGDYHLSALSPCLGAGLIQSWMSGATELDGRPRTRNNRVDLGCYQALPPPGTLLFIR